MTVNTDKVDQFSQAMWDAYNIDVYDVFQFLFDLQESGKTNMYGAVPYMLEEFPDLDKEKALNILQFWMENYKLVKEWITS